MGTPAEVLRSRQALKDEAYKLVLRSMIGKDALDSALLSKMRMELNIEALNHRKWLQELMQSKQNNTLFSNIPPAGPQPGPSAGPMPTPAGAGAGPSSAAHLAHTSANHRLQHQHAGAPQAMHLHSGSGQLGHAASAAAALPARAASQRQLAASQPPSESKADGKGGGPKPKKMKALAASAGPMVPEYIGRKVKRFWAKEGGWYDGVITDFKQNNGQYCITYDFNSRNESFEWLDLTAHMQEGQVKMLPDKVDLRNFPNSRAVQSSSVVRPKAKAGDGPSAKKKAAGGSESGVTGRKRNYAVFESDSDFDDL